MECREALELLPAHADRELGGREAIEIVRHLEGCAGCRAQHEVYAALRLAVREHATYFRASDRLANRIGAVLPSPRDVRVPRTRRGWNWLSVGGTLASVVAVAWSVALILALPSAEDRVADEVVSGHIRSLLPNHTVDVASSDQHTVKPWFNGKVDFSPPVVDLTMEGFPLLGGRLDYLDHRPVAALVYRHRQHMINLFVSPTAGSAQDAPPKSLSRQGYHVLHWARGGMAFWAVSDVDPAELAKLRETLLSKG